WKEIKGEKENPAKIKEFFDSMDKNKDNRIDFNEFMTFMAGFTCLCYGMACPDKKEEQDKK
uniref:EF-hand domain-containing protein n=1 Tax=Neogobius melanostomus TaxID=47308 RepID=A0A8C6S363_9GOBI